MTTEPFSVVAYGIDDLSLGFDMTGSPSIGALHQAAGVQTRRGKMLGEPSSWGKWSHLFGRSAAFWKADTNRLYVQAKLAAVGELCPPEGLRAGVQALRERMAIVGVTTPEEPWVTRLDIAVDATCAPADGKLLLDALEAVRLPNGWRSSSAGSPRSTVYFRARGSDHVLGRAYCRNLKTKTGEAFGTIRLEAEQRYDPRACPAESLGPKLVAAVWRSRYGNLADTVVRLGREGQTVEISGLVQRGEITYQQGERMAMFLDLERLGLASAYYPRNAYTTRRREATTLGLALNETRSLPIAVELAALLAPYRRVVEQAA